MKIRIVSVILLLTVLGVWIKIVARGDDFINPTKFHDRNLGSSAHELLSPEEFTSLKVEIQYMGNFAPDSMAVENLKVFLKTYLQKPAGISVVQKRIQPSTDRVLTRDEIMQVEKSNRSLFAKQNQITVYVLYTNGTHAEKNILGMAYRNTSVVLFGKTIKSKARRMGKAGKTALETSVLNHEISHLLGLEHCENTDCLMHATTQVKSAVAKGDLFPTLDATCEERLKSILLQGFKED